MNLARMVRHLFTGHARVRRCFPPTCIAAITRAIADSETTHHGEIRFAIEAALSPLQLLRGVDARARALELFSALRIWDTEHNSGVLIYVLQADHAIEIVADRGINLRVADGAWAAIAQAMRDQFSRGRYQAGALDGIAAVSRELKRHLPAADGAPNELGDDVTLL
ncbi:putative membrane protein [Duganella sp. 1411]|uniref:TPM domain-containing protein n=1 Tax=Duganella sp. 1411 TaxID=2806572 RepID=UPI001AE2487D|nr:TPM domain-containing protein [Duganella sp. 1411]MBP1202685.1 putative membrane protein [Duganella sp. 1411]